MYVKQQTKKTLIGYYLPVLFSLVLGVFFLVLGGWFILLEYNRDIKTWGSITTVNSTRKKVHYTVSFHTQSKEQVEITTSSRSTDEPSLLRRGDSVEVIYDLEQPHHARINRASERPGSLYNIGFIIMGVFLLWASVGNAFTEIALLGNWISRWVLMSRKRKFDRSRQKNPRW